MGWCYTFGVDCDSGCKHPMFVQESLDACRCEQCGVTCTGRFANCWRSIFQPNGLVVQQRCVPRTIPAGLTPVVPEPVVEAPGVDATAHQAVTVAAVPDQPNTPSNGNGNGNGHNGADRGRDELVARLSGDISDLRYQVADLTAQLKLMTTRNDQLEKEIRGLSNRLATAQSLSDPSPTVGRQVAPVPDYGRPQRAVGHDDAVRRGIVGGAS